MKAISKIAIVMVIPFTSARVIFAQNVVVQKLYEQIGILEQTERFDLVSESLQKLKQVAPDDVRTKIAVSRDLLRQGNHNAIDLQKIQISSTNDNPAIERDLSILKQQLQDQTTNKPELERAHLLATVGRYQDALDIFNRIYLNPPLSWQQQLWYYQWMFKKSDERSKISALNSIKGLYKEYPHAPRIQMELARMMYARDVDILETTRLLQKASRHLTVEIEAKRLWQRILDEQTPSALTVQLYNEYLDSFPKEANYQSKRDEMNAWLSDPHVKSKMQGLALLNQPKEATDKELVQAWTLLQTALSRFGDDDEIWGHLGIVKLRQAEYQEANKLFSKASQLNTGSQKWQNLLKTSQYWGTIAAFKEARARKDPQKSRQLLQKIASQRSQQTYPPNETYLAWQAEVLRLENRPKEAYKIYSELIAKSPSWEVKYAWIELSLLLGFDAKVRRYLTENPDPDLLQTRLKVEHKRLESLPNANKPEALKSILQLNPNDTWTRYSLAKHYIEQNNSAAALKLFSDKQHMKSVDDHYTCAMILLRLNRHSDAYQQLKLIPVAQRTPQIISLMLESSVRDPRISAQTKKSRLKSFAIPLYMDTHSDELLTYAIEINDLKLAHKIVSMTKHIKELRTWKWYQNRYLLAFNGGHNEAAYQYLKLAKDTLALSPDANRWQHDSIAHDLESLQQSLKKRWALSYEHLEEYYTKDPSVIASMTVNSPTVNGFEATVSQLELKDDDQKLQGTVPQMSWTSPVNHKNRFHLHIGHMPANFLLNYPIYKASWHHSGEIFNQSFSTYKTPVTSSRISLGGALDSQTGKLFGGVNRNGISWQGSYDQGDSIGVWASLGFNQLKGTRIIQNQESKALIGGYYRLIQQDRHELSLGTTLMSWRFLHNVNNSALGYGDYYSPKDFRLISFPLEYKVATYDLAASLGVSPSLSLVSTSSETIERTQSLTYRGKIETVAMDRIIFGGAIELDRKYSTQITAYMVYWLDESYHRKHHKMVTPPSAFFN